MKNIITILLISFATYAVAQAPEWQWVKKAGGYGHDLGKCVGVDSVGNTYVAGSYESTHMSFGSITISNTDSMFSSRDLYITKYDSHGNVLWAKSVGGLNANEEANSIAVEPNGNFYITGYFSTPSLAFDSITLNLTAGGPNNIFIAKYNTNGNVLWAKSAGSVGAGASQYDIGNSISIDGNGNCYITGYFLTSDITFGGIVLTNTGISYNMFIVKYDASGTAVWAQSAGGASIHLGYSIATDISGNSYVTGLYQGTIVFGSTTLTAVGGSDVFIVKYDTNGNVLWAKSEGGNTEDGGRSIATDPAGNCYVTGIFYSPTINWEGTILTNAGSSDMFISKYDTNGNMLWVKAHGSVVYDETNGITADAAGNCYVTGWSDSPLLTIDSTILLAESANQSSLFIIKNDANGNTIWAQGAGAAAYSDTWGQGIVADANGNIYVTGIFTGDITHFGFFDISNSNPGYMSQKMDMFIWKFCSNPVVLPTITASGPTTFCQGDSVTLTASTQNAYLWDNLALATTQSIVVNTQNYLTVTETDANGCSARSALTDVYVNPLPDTTISASGPTTFCMGDSVTLSGSPVEASYLWSNGDTTMNLTSYSSQIVSITVTSVDGCVATSTPHTIITNPLPPIPTITASGPTTFCYPDSVTLTSSLADYYYWNSGYASQNITVYNSLIDSVTVWDINGCASTSLPVSITVNYPTYATQTTTACNSYTSPSGLHTWTISGTYSDTIPNTVGCDSLIDINLTINHSNYSTNYDSISNTFTLIVDSATLANAVSYHWDFGDGTTSALPTPSHTYTTDTTYNVCMKIYTAAGDSCEYCHVIGKDYLGNIIRNGGFTVVVQQSNTGINTISEQQNISIYPNPFTTETTILFSEMQTNSNIKIADVLGKEIKVIHFSGKELILEKGELQNGIYFLQITNESHTTTTKKIVIQ